MVPILPEENEVSLTGQATDKSEAVVTHASGAETVIVSGEETATSLGMTITQLPGAPELVKLASLGAINTLLCNPVA
jgi:hypothetical protein